MILYSAELSPFAAKVRIVCYVKGLDPELPPIPGGHTKSPEFLAINPFGKIPTLVLDDGAVIPESDAIIEYLEDRYPYPPLRPADELERARGRVIAHAAGTYVMDAVRPLFPQLQAGARDQEVIDRAFGEVDTALGKMGQLWGRGPHVFGSSFTLADAAVAPVLFMVSSLGRAFGRAPVFDHHPRMANYYEMIQTSPHFERVLAEMEAAGREFFS